jgi:ribonuclease J
MTKNKLRIIPLGGLGEVGKNMMVYEWGNNILVVDTGMMFPENDMLGIDYIIPDFKYLLDKKDWVRGIVYTHGHEDHIGAAHHVLEKINAPIYATPLTMGLLENKLSREGLINKVKCNTIQASDTITIGPFTVDFFHVCHSIPDGVGLGINTPVGLVVHSGDYKLDHTPIDNWPTDYARLAELHGRGVLALLADSTNSTRMGWTPSERVIDSAFREVFRTAPGRIIIASFASLISRMQQVGNVAHEFNRKLAFAGASMVENVRIARQMGYLDLPENLVIPLDQALKMKPREVVIMSTGTQGEPTSIMGRLSTGTNRQFELIQGDTIVLSSHPIPGNEESVYRTINRLFRRGARVIYEALAPVHVSGHASQEEMKLLLHLVDPMFFIPIHGELRQLHQHALIAQQVGIPSQNIAVVENGQVIELSEANMNLGDRVPGGYVFVDGAGVGDIGPSVVREREELARDGFVLVNLSVDRNTCRLVKEPEIITRGFIFAREGDDYFSEITRVVKDAIACDEGNVQSDLEQIIKTFLYNKTRRRPLVFVTISKL